MAEKLRKKQMGHWCSYCGPKETRAIYRSSGFRYYACEAHKAEIDRYDAIEARMSAYETEGERQSVGRAGF